MLKIEFIWIFLLLPLPWVLRWLLKRAPIQPKSALRVPFFNRIESIVQTHHLKKSHNKFKKALLYIAWVALVIAASNPQWLGKPIAIAQSGRNIVLALDISGSMQIPDMTLNGEEADRLSVVKSAANAFIHHRVGDRLGLILFGTHAYLQTPLTFDRITVSHMLDDASIGLAGKRTAIGDAIGLAIKRLDQVSKKNRILILLTDGASNAGILKPLEAAKLAAEAHIKIYTIGLGADRLVVQGLFSDRVINPSSDLDEETLKKIANMTGGAFFRATDTDALYQVYAKINELEPTKSDKAVFRPITPLYHWPLALVLIISWYLTPCGWKRKSK